MACPRWVTRSSSTRTLWRDFDGWGTLGGWLLGPYAAPANGDEDLAFTSAILDYMGENYCVDPARVFATGHSWGGDMAMVVACFLGDRFRAAVPVAANRPYWFERDGGWADCVGETAMWHMFGEGDTHFTDQAFAGSSATRAVTSGSRSTAASGRRTTPTSTSAAPSSAWSSRGAL